MVRFGTRRSDVVRFGTRRSDIVRCGAQAAPLEKEEAGKLLKKLCSQLVTCPLPRTPNHSTQMIDGWMDG
eukprot:3752220-Rhodomonas_salina.2